MWLHTLRQIPTIFGRLVCLSSLRDEATGRYAHPVLVPLVGVEEADRTLRHSHHQVFTQWIGSSLEDQKADLEEYLGTAGGGQDVFRRYRRLTPPTARDVERQLYLADLETLLELLRCERPGVFSIPAASPPR